MLAIARTLGDAFFKPGMTKQQCEDFVTKGLCHAMARCYTRRPSPLPPPPLSAEPPRGPSPVHDPSRPLTPPHAPPKEDRQTRCSSPPPPTPRSLPFPAGARRLLGRNHPDGHHRRERRGAKVHCGRQAAVRPAVRVPCRGEAHHPPPPPSCPLPSRPCYSNLLLCRKFWGGERVCRARRGGLQRDADSCAPRWRVLYDPPCALCNSQTKSRW